jgi:predicted branched-subunit amino acid permease
MDVSAADIEQLGDFQQRQAARRAAATSGVRAIAPLAVGLAPLALTVGATAARVDIPVLAGWGSSALLYGASGQLIWMDVLDSGGPAALAVVAAVIVNLQLLLYGAAMRTYWIAEPHRWRVASAHLMVGPVFAVATGHHRDEPDPELRRCFYMGAAVTLWVVWVVLNGLGAVFGGLPVVRVLVLLGPLVLLSLAVRAVVDSATTAALVVAAVVAVVGTGLPFDLGSIGAGAVGVFAGVAVDSRRRRQQVTAPEAAE